MLRGLTDRSRRPYRYANQLPFQIEKLIIQLKKEFPHWGAPKIRERLKRLYLFPGQRVALCVREGQATEIALDRGAGGKYSFWTLEAAIEYHRPG
jgi:hypothetical protein